MTPADGHDEAEPVHRSSMSASVASIRIAHAQRAEARREESARKQLEDLARRDWNGSDAAKGATRATGSSATAPSSPAAPISPGAPSSPVARQSPRGGLPLGRPSPLGGPAPPRPTTLEQTSAGGTPGRAVQGSSSSASHAQSLQALARKSAGLGESPGGGAGGGLGRGGGGGASAVAQAAGGAGTGSSQTGAPRPPFAPASMTRARSAPFMSRPDSEPPRKVLVGVCAMRKKAESKPMLEIIKRLVKFGEFEVITFGDEMLLNEPIENWPVVECLLAWFSDGFPLKKAQRYVSLRKPYLVNDVFAQDLLLDRRKVYRRLSESGIPVPKHIIVDRDVPARSAADGDAEGGGAEGGGGGDRAPSAAGDGEGEGAEPSDPEGEGAEPGGPDGEGGPGAPAKAAAGDPPGFIETEDYVELDGVRIHKPFVEKPSSGEDHNIYIYYPFSMGGGVKKLFRKVNNKSADYDPRHPGNVRRDASYIYEQFLPTGGTDVKVYTVGPRYAHAEARKSPVVDGTVQRTRDGKEVRYPVLLSPQEKEIARMVSLTFGQRICGFDLLRSERDRSYVCDVNGWSFVKNSVKYYDDASGILRIIILSALRPERLRAAVGAAGMHIQPGPLASAGSGFSHGPHALTQATSAAAASSGLSVALGGPAGAESDEAALEAALEAAMAANGGEEADETDAVAPTLGSPVLLDAVTLEPVAVDSLGGPLALSVARRGAAAEPEPALQRALEPAEAARERAAAAVSALGIGGGGAYVDPSTALEGLRVGTASASQPDEEDDGGDAGPTAGVRAGRPTALVSDTDSPLAIHPGLPKGFPPPPPDPLTGVRDGEELRCVLAVIRHGDRTPKQKMKVKVSQRPLLDICDKYLDSKRKEAKLKSPAELQELLDAVRGLLKAYDAEAEVREAAARAEAETVEAAASAEAEAVEAAASADGDADGNGEVGAGAGGEARTRSEAASRDGRSGTEADDRSEAGAASAAVRRASTSKDDDTEEIRERFRIIKSVLEQGGAFAGINRKVQLKPLRWEEVEGGEEETREAARGGASDPQAGAEAPDTLAARRTTSEPLSSPAAAKAAAARSGGMPEAEAAPPEAGGEPSTSSGAGGAPPARRRRVAECLLILKHGGVLTHAGRGQAEQLGSLFRNVMYPTQGPSGGGLLRLHSTYRHDLKIYSSDEGRVQSSAAAFTKGLLDLEGSALTPIFVSLVTKDAGMLDAFAKGASDEIQSAKRALYAAMTWDPERKRAVYAQPHATTPAASASTPAVTTPASPVGGAASAAALESHPDAAPDAVAAPGSVSGASVGADDAPPSASVITLSIAAEILSNEAPGEERPPRAAPPTPASLPPSYPASKEASVRGGTAGLDRCASGAGPEGAAAAPRASPASPPAGPPIYPMPDRPLVRLREMHELLKDLVANLRQKCVDQGVSGGRLLGSSAKGDTSKGPGAGGDGDPSTPSSVAYSVLIDSPESWPHPPAGTPCGGERLLLTYDRWRKLERALYNHKKGEYDISKVPDIYDAAKYDALHNAEVVGPVIRRVFPAAKRLADAVIPNEYGIKARARLAIGSAICGQLLGKLLADLASMRDESFATAKGVVPGAASDSADGRGSGKGGLGKPAIEPGRDGGASPASSSAAVAPPAGGEAAGREAPTLGVRASAPAPSTRVSPAPSLSPLPSPRAAPSAIQATRSTDSMTLPPRLTGDDPTAPEAGNAKGSHLRPIEPFEVAGTADGAAGAGGDDPGAPTGGAQSPLPMSEDEGGEDTASLTSDDGNGHRLCPTYATDINSPLRHVRTRIYFTSESHMHSLVSVLRYAHLGAGNGEEGGEAAGGPDRSPAPPSEAGADRRSAAPASASAPAAAAAPAGVVSPEGEAVLRRTHELDYMTHVVLRMFENQRLPLDDPSRFRVEVLFSPGAAYDPTAVVPAAGNHTLPVAPRVPIHTGGAEGITHSDLERHLKPYAKPFKRASEPYTFRSQNLTHRNSDIDYWM